MIRTVSSVRVVDSDVVSGEHHDLQQRPRGTTVPDLRHIDFVTI